MPKSSCCVRGCLTVPSDSDLVGFYKVPTNSERREIWIHNIGVTKTGRVPSVSSRVCSMHFVDGQPTTENPNPILHMGHDDIIAGENNNFFVDQVCLVLKISPNFYQCVELEEYEAADINYHCPSCEPQHGHSEPKPVRNSHRYDYSDTNAADKPAESGTTRLVQELKKRKYPDASDVIDVMENGDNLTVDNLEQTTFRTPILVENLAGLGLVVPPSTFTADDVENLVGGDRYVDVIDVYFPGQLQNASRDVLEFLSPTTPAESVKYDTLGVLGYGIVEVSENAGYRQRPELDRRNIGRNHCDGRRKMHFSTNTSPLVRKYRNSAQSPWRNLIRISILISEGEKVFYLIEPSAKNLQLFEDWKRSPNSSEQFFGDLVSVCYSLVLKPGQTFFVPTGWILAVYTPSDSLMVGGNFLHSFNIGLQIRLYEMEKSGNTADKFMFPHFELANWYAGIHLLDFLKDLNDERKPAKPYLLKGLKALAAAMKTWIQRNQEATLRCQRCRTARLIFKARSSRRHRSIRISIANH